jgi:hypothetical protein
MWLVKLKDSENGLHFDIASKLDLANFKINVIEHGGESVKLKSLLSQAVTKGIILYDDVNFAPYPLNVP